MLLKTAYGNEEEKMNADIFSYEGEGIQCVYDNKNWVMCIKNWKPNK